MHSEQLSEMGRPSGFDADLEAHFCSYYLMLVNMVASFKSVPSYHVAEEIVSDMYCRALEESLKFDPSATTLATWLGSKILPAALQYALRHEKKSGMNTPIIGSEDEQIDTTSNPETMTYAAQIIHLISAQRSPQRRIIYDVLIGGESYADTASRHRVNLNFVKKTIFKFRKEIGGEDGFRRP